MARVSLDKVTKRYGDVEAVHQVSLEIPDQELVVLVGPSGCGKSTTLRMIAGLEEISGGEIRIGDRVVNRVAPADRDIAMVFQSYALYPHMSVRQNLEFGLRMRRTPRAEIDKRVQEAASILEIEGLLERKPKHLSGGQRQRVAMGRAIVRRPAVFLFDEPLSNLDAKLRVQMRTEISRLHSRLLTTTIYVTHDQVEAMTLADRIVVMKDGVVQQVGVPLELYDRPCNLFVAGFIGTPAMNFVEGELSSSGSGLVFLAQGIRIAIPPDQAHRLSAVETRRVVLGARPPDLLCRTSSEPSSPPGDGSDGPRATEPLAGADELRARVEVREPLGSEVYLHLVDPLGGWVIRVEGHSPVREGDEVSLALRPGSMHLFDRESGRSLTS